MKLGLVQKAFGLSVYLFPLFLGLVTQCGIKKPVSAQHVQESPHSHLYIDTKDAKTKFVGEPKK